MKYVLCLVALVVVFTQFALHALAPVVVPLVHIMVDPAIGELILRSTLQIAMFEHASEGGGAEPGVRGLGTLVVYGEETLIVTHDHWEYLTPNLHEVEMRDDSGQLLLTLDAQAFRALITYRDGGSMILQAPAGLHGLVPAALGAAADQGDVVWFARRDLASGRLTVEVVGATVMAMEDDARPASMRLRNLDGGVVLPGDSGGGVWANGKLIGNLWAAGVREERGIWRSWYGGDHDEPSDLTIAALQPLGEQTDAAAIELGPGTHGEQEISTKQDQLQTTLLAD